MIAIGTTDLSHLGQVMDVSARFAGAVVSFIVVAVILLQTSVTLGLVVLLGVPLLMVLLGPILAPLQRRSQAQRELMGRLSNTASDIVGGLRVLRGIGGEDVFHARYTRESQAARRAGVQVARLQSLLDAAQIFLPGIFVVTVVWLGARYAVQGRISPGDLVAFYGYSAFLMVPLRTATEYANKLIRGLVSAERVCRVLAHTPDHVEPSSPAPAPPPGAPLTDARSGLVVVPGQVTALVSDNPDETAALADRLGMCEEGPDEDVRLGGVPLVRLGRAEVRRRILVSDTAAALFSGRLAHGVDPTGAATASGALDRALDTASAADVLESLSHGLETRVAERGRTFSGGQRQRLILARALTVDPEILVLVEATSAVDAHTEARIASRLTAHRSGRTTVVVTSSPLLLDIADKVAFVRGGLVVASGTHVELLAADPDYRAVVTREISNTLEQARR